MRERKTVRIRQRAQAGFTLIEMMIATVVLSVGVLGLAATLADGLAYMDMSKYDYIAQQKASEAVESIFTARDMGEATWASICNVGSGTGCIFLSGPQSLCDPGPDGIVGTADDNCAGLPDAILLPGPDGRFSDAVRVPLSAFTRTITITPINTNLTQIQVDVTYSTGRWRGRTRTLITNISNFS
jgi:prepilin-type N-terminal cleavage/methylation domain-containing protein